MDTDRRPARTNERSASDAQSARIGLGTCIAVCLMIVPITDVYSETGIDRAATSTETSRAACCQRSNHPTVGEDDDHGLFGNKSDGEPDKIADYTGGLAARLRRIDGTAVPGDLFLLMASVGSDAPARLYADTPYTHDSAAHDDTLGSNRLAIDTVENITGITPPAVEFTSAPGGGPSGGLLYTIAYLNMISDGAFTERLRIAATGEVVAEGYLDPITAPNEKTGAARLAGVDVLFMTSAPSHPTAAAHTGRIIGQPYRSRYGRASLFEERSLDDYRALGAGRSDVMDIVLVGHIADVAAYLCGSGSTFACDIVSQLGPTFTSDPVVEATRSPISAAAVDQAPPSHPAVGNLH